MTANLNTKVEAIELELDAMLQVMEEMRNGIMTEEAMDISRRMDEVAAEQAAGTAAVSVEEMIKSLVAADKEAAQMRLDSIEARMEVDHAKVEIGNPSRGGAVLISALDLRGYFKRVDGGNTLSFGGFADVYTYLSRIHSCQDNISMEAMVKAHKDVKSLDISLAEANLIPAIFGIG